MYKKLENAFGWINGIVATVAVIVAIWAVENAPVEQLQGIPQKIFYLHVTLAWNAFGLCAVGFVSAIVYLITRRFGADRLSAVMMQVGMLYITAVLVTGPIWARPIWGTYWVWDPRLTTTLLLWILLAVYHLLRASIASPERRARISAVVALLIAVDIPVIHVSVMWWRSLHPLPVVMRKGNVGEGLDPEMRLPLMLMGLALFAVGAVFVEKNMRIERAENKLTEASSS